jgi:hypothetical protein
LPGRTGADEEFGGNSVVEGEAEPGRLGCCPCVEVPAGGEVCGVDVEGVCGVCALSVAQGAHSINALTSMATHARGEIISPTARRASPKQRRTRCV